MITVAIGMATVAFLALVLLVDRIPADAMTITRMRVIEQRIREYAAKRGRLPVNLADLDALLGDRDENTADGWGRPIRYLSDDGTVTLRSLGKDGRVGGSGKDADIELTFTVVVSSAPASQ